MVPRTAASSRMWRASAKCKGQGALYPPIPLPPLGATPLGASPAPRFAQKGHGLEWRLAATARLSAFHRAPVSLRRILYSTASLYSVQRT